MLAGASLGALAPRGSPAPPARLDGCVTAGPGVEIVDFSTGSGEALQGAVLGHGSTGVVLANESDLDLCDWLPFARGLARGGFRPLLFDYRGGYPQSEVAAAARELRRLGARRVVLVGASEGAKASIVAASRIPSLASAVVALSPERTLAGRDVTPAAKRLRVPSLFAVSQHDPYAAADTPALARVARSARKRLVTVPGDAHGVALLEREPAATVAAAVRTFLLPFVAKQRPETLAAECGTAVAASAPRPAPVAFVAADGYRLHGVVFGEGSTTVVLAHEYPNTLCGWFPYAAELARSGIRVFLFDLRGSGARLDLDVAAAVDTAKSLGATRVVAMGASLGGAATLAAAGRDCLLVSGVVSVSGERDLRFYGRGVPPVYELAYEPRITAPLLVVGSKRDSLVDAADVKRLLSRARAKDEHSVLVDGWAHGWELLQGDTRSAAVRRAVLDFLRRASRPVATGCPR